MMVMRPITKTQVMTTLPTPKKTSTSVLKSNNSNNKNNKEL